MSFLKKLKKLDPLGSKITSSSMQRKFDPLGAMLSGNTGQRQQAQPQMGNMWARAFGIGQTQPPSAMSQPPLQAPMQMGWQSGPAMMGPQRGQGGMLPNRYGEQEGNFGYGSDPLRGRRGYGRYWNP